MGRFCARHGLDFAAVLAVLHGVRSVDTIRAVAPGVDAEAEAALLDAAEEVDTDGLVVVRGAPELLARLPAGSWGIVTSGHRSLAERRLRAVGLPVPAAMVCGDEVPGASPTPRASWPARGCSASRPRRCVAIEDAPAGIRRRARRACASSASPRRTRPPRWPAANAVIADLTRVRRRARGARRGRSRRAGAQPR